MSSVWKHRIVAGEAGCEPASIFSMIGVVAPVFS